MLRRLAAAVFLAAFAIPGYAQWELDTKRSSIYFISVKNAAVAETHHFSGLLGYIGEDGKVHISIDLASVQTMIDIRNERMREMLFETVKFPTATVSATVDPAVLDEVEAGSTIGSEIPVTLSLHGVDKTLTVPITVFSDGGSLRVMTPHPVILKSEDFGLAPGVEALRAVAGLDNISTAVPVSFSLLFKTAK